MQISQFCQRRHSHVALRGGGLAKGLLCLVFWSSFAACLPVRAELRPAEARTATVQAAAAQPAAAQPAPQATSDLADRARGQQFREIPPERLQTARRRLDAAIAVWEQLLKNSGTAVDAGWRRYVMWDATRAELAKEKPNYTVMRRSLPTLFQDEVGLEMPQFRELRSALRDYVNLASFQSLPNRQQQIEVVLARTATVLQQLANAPSDGGLAQLAQYVGLLEQYDQATELTAEIRRRYAQPNLYVNVSSHFVSSAAARDVNNTTPVRDFILGASIVGTARTHGRLHVDLLPNSQAVSLRLRMVGTTHSNNAGYTRGLTICSTGVTSVCGLKQLVFDESGLRGYAATAQCNTWSSIDGIHGRSKFVRKVAHKQAGKKKSQAEQIASRHAASKVAEQLDQQAAVLLAEANQKLLEKVRAPLLRRDMYPRSIGLSTSSNKIRFVLSQFGLGQLGASESRPLGEGGPGDVTVRVHETLLGNAAESILSGQTLTDTRLIEMLTEAGQEIPEELRQRPDRPPWSITFDPVRPLGVEFRDNKIVFAVRGRRFTQGTQVTRATVRIWAAYNWQPIAGGVRLVRDGDVHVDFPGRRRLGSSQIALRTFLRTRFNGIYKPEFVTSGIELPGELKKVGKLSLLSLGSQRGWLTARWKLTPAQPAAVIPSAQVAASHSAR